MNQHTYLLVNSTLIAYEIDETVRERHNSALYIRLQDDYRFDRSIYVKFFRLLKGP